MTGAHDWVEISLSLGAAVGFILALKWLSHPRTARRGVWAGELGMAAAIAGTLSARGSSSVRWILLAVFVGSAIGAALAMFVPMTAMPQRTALSHAFGALAAALVGTAEYT